MPWTTLSTHATGYLYTAANLNDAWNDINFLAEVNYTAFTADVSITATTVGTANQIVSSGAITYESVPHMIEVYLPRYTAPAQATNIIIRDGTTVLGTLTQIVSSSSQAALSLPYRVTPTAASHTYNAAAWLGGAGTGTIKAGSGGVAGDGTTYVPGFIRITRVPT
jgi:hypothetical protein